VLGGTTEIRWKLVAADGHVMTGETTFTVDADVATTDPDAGSEDGGNGGGAGTTSGDSTISTSGSAPEPVRWAVRLAGYASLVLVGGWFAIGLLFGGTAPPTARIRTVVRAGAVSLCVAPLLQMLMFVGDVRGSSLVGALPRVFDAFDYTPGAMLALRAVLGAVIAASVLGGWVPSGRGQASGVFAAAGALYLVTLAYAGHSRSMGSPWLGIPVDVAHTAAAVAWLGGLGALALGAARTESPQSTIDVFVRFGGLARTALAVIVGTGVVQTLRLHGGITSLFSESHGRWLLVKLVAVVVMLRVAEVNRRRTALRISGSEAQVARRAELLRRATATEFGVGLGVLAVTAVLVGAPFS
jgi:putative copper export protein